MADKRQILIPATEGAAFVVRRGETIKVIDVEGHQIGDFICFNLHQPKEKLSTWGNGELQLSLFQNTRAKADGTIDYQPAAAKAGEHIALKAVMDCLVAISACPFDGEVDGGRPNGPKCTPLRVEFVGE